MLFLNEGNEVLFSLETATDYVRNEKASAWGFRCSVLGYEGLDMINGVRQLETELAYLGGMCAASLMKRELLLPIVSGTFSSFVFHGEPFQLAFTSSQVVSEYYFSSIYVISK